MPVQPSTQTLTNGQSQQFALVDATGNPVAGVTWSAAPAGLVNLSPQGLVTAPPVVAAETNITITAAPPQCSSEQAIVRLVPLEVVLVPDKVSLRDGEMQRFEATVPGDPANGVHWVIAPAIGAFDEANSTYTAPALNLEDREVQVIATSAIDPHKRATATVKLQSKPPWLGVTIGLFLYLVGIFSLVFLLISLWPPATATDGKVSTWWFGAISRDVDLLWLVLITGALGSFAHGARSFVDFVGNRTLRTSWSAWYLMYPFIGASLALIFYLAVRGGFMTTNSTNDVNVFGLTAISGLVGMFSKQATTKLGEVFSTLFKSDKDDKPLKNKVS